MQQKRIHRDPYGDYLASLVGPSQSSEPYEPDEAEVTLYRATLDFIKQRFGEDSAKAVVISAGIESGSASDDDLDIDLYESALDYVRETFGKEAEAEVLRHLESFS